MQSQTVIIQHTWQCFADCAGLSHGLGMPTNPPVNTLIVNESVMRIEPTHIGDSTAKHLSKQ